MSNTTHDIQVKTITDMLKASITGLGYHNLSQTNPILLYKAALEGAALALEELLTDNDYILLRRGEITYWVHPDHEDNFNNSEYLMAARKWVGPMRHAPDHACFPSLTNIPRTNTKDSPEEKYIKGLISCLGDCLEYPCTPEYMQVLRDVLEWTEDNLDANLQTQGYSYIGHKGFLYAVHNDFVEGFNPIEVYEKPHIHIPLSHPIHTEGVLE